MVFWYILFIMIIWWFIQTVFTDPGEVPTFWGFRKGDPISRRKRYWLICNVFKPERWHHWSTCNRWVLNMDHHWPWISNCIGFWNRKYFILLLFYVIIGMFSYELYMLNENIAIFIDLYYYFKGEDIDMNFVKTTIIITATLLGILIWAVMVNFFRFHLMLLFDNKTTIEWIANRHEPFKSKFDLSWQHNFRQVFGK